MNIRRLLAGTAIAAAALSLTGCGTLIETDSQTQVLWYKDGAFEAPIFQGCVGPNTYDRKGLDDDIFRYPAGDRTWSFNPRPDADTGPITIKTKDGQEMTVVGLIQFVIVDATSEQEVVPPPEPVPSSAPTPGSKPSASATPTPTPTPTTAPGRSKDERCNVLRTFHDRIGLNKGAAFAEGANTSDGWKEVLNLYVSTPVNAVMDRAGLRANVRDLYTNAATQAEFERYVQEQIGPEIDRTLGISGFIRVKSVSIETPQPPPELLDAYKKVEIGKAEAEATRTKAEADIAAQDAKNRLAAQRYKEVESCVKVLGAGNCAMIEMQKGPNPPQWIPQGSTILVDGVKN